MGEETSTNEKRIQELETIFDLIGEFMAKVNVESLETVQRDLDSFCRIKIKEGVGVNIIQGVRDKVLPLSLEEIIEIKEIVEEEDIDELEDIETDEVSDELADSFFNKYKTDK